MLRIGLTGGIGSGKSTVADLFAARGAPVIDTDLIARELVAPGQPALAEIQSRFGSDVIDAEGNLNRAALRNRVFADPAERRALEKILHPPIRAVVEQRVAALGAPYVLIVVPLLFESGWDALVDRILVVDVPIETQRARVTQRDGLAGEIIDDILAAQLPRDERRRRADDLLDNSGTPAETARQVERLHEHYLQLAGA